MPCSALCFLVSNPDGCETACRPTFARLIDPRQGRRGTGHRRSFRGRWCEPVFYLQPGHALELAQVMRHQRQRT